MTLARSLSLVALAAASPVPFPAARAQVCPIQELVASDAGPGAFLGFSTAADGNTLLAGAPSDDNAMGNDAGAVYVFTRSGSEWTEEAKILGPAASSSFGSSVALVGDTALIGAEGYDMGATQQAGAAFVYVRSGTTWTQQAMFTAAAPEADGFFGTSVSLAAGVGSGLFADTAFVGHPGDDAAGPVDSGSAYVFQRTGTTWGSPTVLTASDASAGAGFGASVSLWGITSFGGSAAIGAPNPGGLGAAYTFSFEITEPIWEEDGKLVQADGAADDRFGQLVATSGDALLVAAIWDDDACPGNPGCNSGSVYVYASGAPVAKLTASDAQLGDNFGLGIAIDGDQAIVGAPSRALGSGTAFSFTRTGTTWTQDARILPADNAQGDFFGIGPSFAGGQVAIGALGDSSAAPGAGAVYVLERTTLAAVLFESDGVVVNESDGSPHAATKSLLSTPDRAMVLATVQAIFDDGLGVGTVIVREGTEGCVGVVVSNGTAAAGGRYGNAGEERAPALAFEGEFRASGLYTESELVLAMSETIAHELGHKLGLQGHNCDAPPNIMTAGEKVPAGTRKQGLRRFGAADQARIVQNRPLVTAEPKPGADPNDLAILNGSFCVPPADRPDDGYLGLEAVFSSADDFAEFGYLNSFGEFVYQGDTTHSVVNMGSHFDGGFDLAVRSGGSVFSFSNGDGCYVLAQPNPVNPAVYLSAEVEFPGVPATLRLDVLDPSNRNGGLLFPATGPACAAGTPAIRFCAAKTTLTCGTPSISASGTSSASATSGYTLTAAPARTCKSGILLYSSAPLVAAAPFQGGELCLEPMGLRRAGSTNSMGTPGGANCDGAFAVDMNAFAASAWTVPACDGSPSGIPPNSPAGFLAVPGTTVSAQFWGRDSLATGSFVSDGLSFEVGP